MKSVVKVRSFFEDALYIITIIIPWMEVSSLQLHNCVCKNEISGHETDNSNDILPAFFYVFL